MKKIIDLYIANLKQLSFGTEGVCNAIVVEIWSTRNMSVWAGIFLCIFPCVSFLSKKNWNSSFFIMEANIRKVPICEKKLIFQANFNGPKNCGSTYIKEVMIAAASIMFVDLYIYFWTEINLASFSELLAFCWFLVCCCACPYHRCMFRVSLGLGYALVGYGQACSCWRRHLIMAFCRVKYARIYARIVTVKWHSPKKKKYIYYS